MARQFDKLNKLKQTTPGTLQDMSHHRLPHRWRLMGCWGASGEDVLPRLPYVMPVVYQDDPE